MKCDLQKKYQSIISSGFDRQRNEGFKARPDANPVKMQIPLQWKHDDPNLLFNLNAWRFLNPYWGELLRTDNVAFFTDALCFMEDWLRFAKEGTSKMTWYNMAVGVRCLHIAFALEYARRTDLRLSPKREALLGELAKRHIEYLQNKKNITKGNHAIHQIKGLAVLADVLGEEVQSYTCPVLRELLDAGFDENFVSTENSPFYHAYNLNLIEQLDPSLFPGLSHKITRIKREASAITPWLTDPNGEFYLIGDTERRRPPLTQVDKGDTGSAHGYVFKDLRSSGYQIVRDYPPQSTKAELSLVFYALNRSYTHAHDDCLSLIAFHRGKMLLSDSGKYSYENDRWRGYFTSDTAHNTVGVEGVIMQPQDTPLGSATMDPLVSVDDGICFKGRVEKLEGKLFHEREMILYKNRTLRIVDRVENQVGKRTELRFHLGRGVSVEMVDRNKFQLIREGLEVASVEVESDDITVDIANGITEPVIQGWISESYHDKVPADVLLVRCPSGKKSINTLITLH